MNPSVGIAIKAFCKKNSSLMALIVIIVFSSLFLPNFVDARNITAILFQVVVIGFLALGQFLVILTGGIDLSQGAMIAFTSIVASVSMRNLGVWPSIVISIAATTAIGFLNGVLVAKTRMPAFIITLGMMGIVRGLAMMLANAKPVPIEDESFKILGAGRIWLIPLSFIFLMIVMIITSYFLRNRRMGRYLYAVGSNEDSANLSGVSVAKVKLLTYTASALFASIGGLIWCSRLVSGSPIGASGYEMESIAAVVVGGGSLAGGEGTVMGTLSGVLIFQCINSILNLTGINPFWQGAFKGLLILVAVVLSRFRTQSVYR